MMLGWKSSSDETGGRSLSYARKMPAREPRRMAAEKTRITPARRRLPKRISASDAVAMGKTIARLRAERDSLPRGREADPFDERRRIHFAAAEDASGRSGGCAASNPQPAVSFPSSG